MHLVNTVSRLRDTSHAETLSPSRWRDLLDDAGFDWLKCKRWSPGKSLARSWKPPEMPPQDRGVVRERVSERAGSARIRQLRARGIRNRHRGSRRCVDSLKLSGGRSGWSRRRPITAAARVSFSMRTPQPSRMNAFRR